MKKTTNNLNFQGLRSSSLAVAVGLVCSSPSLADSTKTGHASLAQLLPDVFSRIDYVATQPTIERIQVAEYAYNDSLQQFNFIQPLDRSDNASRTSTYRQAVSTPAPSADEAQLTDSDKQYANEDLDLALENFFYALEDLIQSASRHADINTDKENTYIAQVQFPVNVMTSLSTANPATVSSAPPTAVASTTNAPVTLPPARTSVDSVKPSAFAFLDSFKFSSQLKTDVEFNDNIYTTRANRESDFVSRNYAKGTLESRTRKSALKFEGDIHAGIYKDHSEDNYFDYSATASYSTLLSERSKAFAGLGYFIHHEDRGEGSTDGDLGTSLGQPVEFESYVARGIYERGTKRTRGRLVADAKLDQLRAKNFREIDAIRGRDRDITALVGTAFYNWSQRVSFLVEMRHQDISYVNTASNINSLDSTQTRYAFGAEWLATRKTAGSVRVGLQEKDFNSGENTDFRNLSWEAVIDWTPRPRTEIIFETLSDTEESDGFGSARDRTDYKISWKQKWTPRISSTAYLQAGETDFREQERRDNTSIANAAISYSINSSTNASVKLTYLDNSSTLDEFDFDRTQIQVGLDMEL